MFDILYLEKNNKKKFHSELQLIVCSRLTTFANIAPVPIHIF